MVEAKKKNKNSWSKVHADDTALGLPATDKQDARLIPPEVTDVSPGVHEVENIQNPEKSNPLPTGKRVSKKSTPVANLMDFYDKNYRGNSKRLVLKPGEVASIKNASFLSEDNISEILTLAANDRLLDRTRELLLLVVRINHRSVTERSLGLINRVLLGHPAFAADPCQQVLISSAPDSSTAAALRSLADQEFQLPGWRDGGVNKAKADNSTCRHNAIQCLLLILLLSGRIDPSDVINLLQTYLWRDLARKAGNELQQSIALIVSKDPLSATITYQIQNMELSRIASQSHRGQLERDSAREKASELSTLLQECREQVKSLEIARDKTAQELADERERFRVARIHMQADMDELRGKYLHRLITEVQLLEDGLSAIRMDPPRVHVMDDHANRVIDALRREICRLKGES